jgi:hypothetical protein
MAMSWQYSTKFGPWESRKWGIKSEQPQGQALVLPPQLRLRGLHPLHPLRPILNRSAYQPRVCQPGHESPARDD